jgi:hypothetical protein
LLDRSAQFARIDEGILGVAELRTKTQVRLLKTTPARSGIFETRIPLMLVHKKISFVGILTTALTTHRHLFFEVIFLLIVKSFNSRRNPF